VILVLAPADDVHGRCVAKALQARGARFAVLDAAQLGEAAQLSVTAGARAERRWSTGAASVDLDAVATVWHRRLFLPQAPASFDAFERRFAEREWRETLLGTLAALPARFVNEPAAETRAVKPLQLALAQRLGLRVPDTLITNDRREAEAFVERHGGRVVHKTLSPPLHRFLPTRRWQPADRDALDHLVHAPTIFQEQVTGRRELRVTVVGQQLFAAEFEPRSIDGRLDLDCGYRPHALPAAVATQVERLVAALGLTYGTLDFKLSDEGEYMFLELNPSGQYLYVEILTALPITAALVDLLCAEASS
jgi:glutathione synthase/RimK-type ligase-like ATP-grasp enzyme